MYTLGINAAFHDPSATIVKDGKVLAAVEEERFNRIKHGKRPLPFNAYELPFYSIDYCLNTAGITLKDVDFIAYSYDPKLKSNGIDESTRDLTVGVSSPDRTSSDFGKPTTSQSGSYRDKNSPPLKNPWDLLFHSYIKSAPSFLISRERPLLPKTLQGISLNEVLKKWHFVEHHLAHAASAFLPSPFNSAAVLTIDGQGENASTAYWIGFDNNLEKLAEVYVPNSLGFLYERVTEFLGFLNSADEYKVMALASYGKPAYIDQFRKIVELTGEGMYQIKAPLTLATLTELLGAPRQKGDEFTREHFNIARSLQNFLEETILELVNWLYQQTGQENLCLAGGVALNCVMNAKIRDKGPFKNIWIQPAAGDAGTSLGAALLIDNKFTQNISPSQKRYFMDNAYLGPGFQDREIEKVLIENKLRYKKLQNLPQETAALLAKDKIIGWFQGRAEFGPRALGARSILASPANPKTQGFLNHIKDREDFRPVAPVVLEEEANKWFEKAVYSPFMLFVFDVLEESAKKIPAVRHIDGTARIQTINRKQNPLYYDLIKAFEAITGVPVLINTSFNKDEPIVLKPEHAIKTFFATPLDALVIGPFLIEKGIA